MSDDKHHQRVVLDTIRRRIDSLTEILQLVDALNGTTNAHTLSLCCRASRH